MPKAMLAQAALLPELKLPKVDYSTARACLDLFVEKTSAAEVCPKCALYSESVCDHRVARVAG